jgi:hypothetical protein
MITENNECNSWTLLTNQLFTILRKNMHNKKEKTYRECNGTKILTGDPSYIMIIKWKDFINHLDFYLACIIHK